MANPAVRSGEQLTMQADRGGGQLVTQSTNASSNPCLHAARPVPQDPQPDCPITLLTGSSDSSVLATAMDARNPQIDERLDALMFPPPAGAPLGSPSAICEDPFVYSNTRA